MHRLYRVLKLSRRESLLLLTTFSFLLAVRLGLFLLPFRTLLRLLKTISQNSIRIYQEADVIPKIVWAVNVSSSYMPGNVKCLARALTTQVLLSWHGYAADLKIGVAKKEGESLEAHAWVEYQNEVVIGALYNLDRFVPFSSVQWFDC